MKFIHKYKSSFLSNQNAKSIAGLERRLLLKMEDDDLLESMPSESKESNPWDNIPVRDGVRRDLDELLGKNTNTPEDGLFLTDETETENGLFMADESEATVEQSAVNQTKLENDESLEDEMTNEEEGLFMADEEKKLPKTRNPFKLMWRAGQNRTVQDVGLTTAAVGGLISSAVYADKIAAFSPTLGKGAFAIKELVEVGTGITGFGTSVAGTMGVGAAALGLLLAAGLARKHHELTYWKAQPDSDIKTKNIKFYENLKMLGLMAQGTLLTGGLLRNIGSLPSAVVGKVTGKLHVYAEKSVQALKGLKVPLKKLGKNLGHIGLGGLAGYLSGSVGYGIVSGLAGVGATGASAVVLPGAMGIAGGYGIFALSKKYLSKKSG